MINYVTEPVVEVQQLTKVFQAGGRERVALDDVSLAIHRGEMVAFMGPTGSGKSTLLNILGLLDGPSAGHYWFAGQNMSALTRVEQAQMRHAHVGVYSRRFRLLPRLSLIQNVALPLAFGRMAEQERIERAYAALERVGLEDFAHARPAILTPLQQQRAALARALVNNPTMLLVDEPSALDDPEMRAEMLNLLRVLNHEQGLTIVVVTNNPTVAQQMDRVIGLRDGRLDPDVLAGAVLGQVLQLPASRARSWCN
jgi:ABC-type lipoprotein export system ATPase subunit